MYYKKKNNNSHTQFPPTYALSFSSNTKDCCLYLMHTLPILSNSKTPLQCTWKKNLEHQCMGQKQIWLVITRCCEIIWQLNGVQLSRDRKVPQVPVTNIFMVQYIAEAWALSLRLGALSLFYNCLGKKQLNKILPHTFRNACEYFTNISQLPLQNRGKKKEVH